MVRVILFCKAVVGLVNCSTLGMLCEGSMTKWMDRMHYWDLYIPSTEVPGSVLPVFELEMHVVIAICDFKILGTSCTFCHCTTLTIPLFVQNTMLEYLVQISIMGRCLPEISASFACIAKTYTTNSPAGMFQ